MKMMRPTTILSPTRDEAIIDLIDGRNLWALFIKPRSSHCFHSSLSSIWPFSRSYLRFGLALSSTILRSIPVIDRKKSIFAYTMMFYGTACICFSAFCLEASLFMLLFFLVGFGLHFRKPVLLDGSRIGWCVSGWRLLPLCASICPAFTNSCLSLACFSHDYGFLSCFPALHVHRWSWARNNWYIWNCGCNSFCFTLIGFFSWWKLAWWALLMIASALLRVSAFDPGGGIWWWYGIAWRVSFSQIMAHNGIFSFSPIHWRQ